MNNTKLIINSVALAHKEFLICMAWLRSQDFDFKEVKFEFGLLNEQEMRIYSQTIDLGQPPLGITQKMVYTKSTGVNHYSVRFIAIISGLLYLNFRRVLIHELIHAWFSINQINASLEIEEGFCELISYQYLRSLNTPQSLMISRDIEMQADILYGLNFRKMKEIGYANGINSLKYLILHHNSSIQLCEIY